MIERVDGRFPVTYYLTSKCYDAARIEERGLVPDRRLPIARSYEGPDRERVSGRVLMALPGPLERVWRSPAKIASPRSLGLAHRLRDRAESEDSDVLELELRLDPRPSTAFVFDRAIIERPVSVHLPFFGRVDAPFFEKRDAKQYWDTRTRLDRYDGSFSVPEVAVLRPVEPEEIVLVRRSSPVEFLERVYGSL